MHYLWINNLWVRVTAARKASGATQSYQSVYGVEYITVFGSDAAVRIIY